MNEKRKDTPRLTDEEEEEIMRRGREALQRINDAKSPELKSAENAYAQAYRKVKSAVLEMLQCHMEMVRQTFLDDGAPEEEANDAAFSGDADYARNELLKEITHPSYDLPESSWWVLSDLFDILASIDRVPLTKESLALNQWFRENRKK